MAFDKKLDIRLPADHPLLQFPQKIRSQKAREAIEAGLAVNQVLGEIKNLLYALDMRMGKLENSLEILQTSGIQPIENKEAEREEAQANVQFDVDAFMNLM
ncbi:hypothetical protein [Desulforamulus ruminis]|uniref:Uncharacterized protein n=1 Tax=Desulforamulus ruminis (strain ATCC 23193 / DSM 2154 / NCIMB 8452 / DL) TaxID=696281 RepID=F6DTV2_DESRL|nr:hypothetical protein [Desulforamulus ruminis]AEG58970.1 hypothetical protein Desru_0685 [Desulforamulus ruminis DSM 2154]